MRTILVHINVELEEDDSRTAEDIERIFDTICKRDPTVPVVALVEEV